MEFYLIKEATLPQVEDLWDYCFEKKESKFCQWYFTKYALVQNKIIGGFQENKLATMLHLNPYTLRLRGEDIKTKYIVGVATDPAFRGQHVMGDLLKTTFNLLRAAGSKVVLLMPINAGIYQPYGFAYTFLRKAYELPLTALTLPAVDYTLKVSRTDCLSAKEKIQKVYERVMDSYDASIARTELNWNNMLTVAHAENVEAIVVETAEEVWGYALYQKEGTTLTVQEMLCTTEAAKKRMLAYFKGLAGTYTNFKWLAADDDLTYLYFKEQAYAPKVTPFMMARIINIEKILEGLKVPASLEGMTFILYVQDAYMNLNNCYAKVVLTKEGVVLKPTVDIPNITMDITTFTQLYFGTYSAQNLAKQGKIMCENEQCLEVLTQLLPKQNIFSNEYF